MTARIRDQLLREDYARAGREYVPAEPVQDSEAVNYTGLQMAHILSDPDELLRAAQLQAEYTRDHDE